MRERVMSSTKFSRRSEDVKGQTTARQRAGNSISIVCSELVHCDQRVSLVLRQNDLGHLPPPTKVGATLPEVRRWRKFPELIDVYHASSSAPMCQLIAEQLSSTQIALQPAIAILYFRPRVNSRMENRHARPHCRRSYRPGIRGPSLARSRGYPTYEDGVSLIKWCVYYGDVSAVRFLLGRGESLTALGENLDLTGAAFHGHWQLCQFLLENDADVNHRANSGETPLHAALCKANRPVYDQVVKVLLASGADPNAATASGAETGCSMRLSNESRNAAASCGCLQRTGDRPVADRGRTPGGQGCERRFTVDVGQLALRPDLILRKLCFDGFFIDLSGARSYDHGRGWEVMGATKAHV